MPKVVLDENRKGEIALRLLKDRYAQLDPKDALDMCQKLTARIVGLGISQDEAIAFVDEMLGDKVRESFVPPPPSGNSTTVDVTAKLDTILRLSSELVSDLFGSSRRRPVAKA